jgi:hypothetical protein
MTYFTLPDPKSWDHPILFSFFLMYLLGFTINVLTLLGIVLAIGLVVDDAIVMLENIFRHIEKGLKPFEAANKALEEITFAIIAMTLTLASVFLPIGFIDGFVGKLFIEFAWTLAFTVMISGITALTLTPTLTSNILTKMNEETSNKLSKMNEETSNKLTKMNEETINKITIMNDETTKQMTTFKKEIAEATALAKTTDTKGAVACTLGMRVRPSSVAWMAEQNRIKFSFIAGRNDMVIPVQKVIAQAKKVNAQLLIIENCGHMAHVENRAECVRFLKKFVQ